MERCAAEVAILANIPMVLSYALPEGEPPQPGCRVRVPVRGAQRIGVVLTVGDAPPDIPLKPIETVLDAEPLIPGDLIALARWCARYYHDTLGRCLALALPPYLRHGKTLELTHPQLVRRTSRGLARLGSRQQAVLEVIPDEGLPVDELKQLVPGCGDALRRMIKSGLLELVDLETTFHTVPAPPLTEEQQTAVTAVNAAIDKAEYHPFLLHGITGSGKTEVFLAAARHALEADRSVIYLVPEIALTPQTVARIRARIPEDMAVIHSGLTDKARAEAFLRVATGEARFVLGTRSAIFAPVHDLGLIIVDEEHDGSYKQSEGVCYNARDLSMVRGRDHRAAVVMGSATPSIESFVRARDGGTTCLSMTSRIGEATLPEVEVVDMCGTKEALSPVLIEAIEQTTARGEQAILFINKRGYAAAMICPGCGGPLSCPRCARSLTYHRSRGAAICHYCGFTLPVPEVCPSCGCLDMRPVGLGTEQVSALIEERFPELRVLRMDSDVITTPARLEQSLKAIRDHEVDVIVGTQMIAKGHDFPSLSLVGVLNAEQGLYQPDFRASERTFSLLVQVAGRAGRTRTGCRVLLQTLMPDHPLIDCIRNHDYHGMVALEDETRKLMNFPPYAHLARIVFSSYDDGLAAAAASRATASLQGAPLMILGPAPAPIALLRNAQRWHLMLCTKDRAVLHQALQVVSAQHYPSKVKVKVDVDPYDML